MTTYTPQSWNTGDQVTAVELTDLSGAVVSASSGIADMSIDQSTSHLQVTLADGDLVDAGAVPAASDATVAPILQDTASASYAAAEAAAHAALDTTIAGNTSAIAGVVPRTGARAVGQHEIFINAADYLTAGSSAEQDNTALNDAISSAAAGTAARVYFPSGSYILSHPLPQVSCVTYEGDAIGKTGQNSTLITWASSMLTPTTTIFGLTFKNLMLLTQSGSGHLIDFDTATGPAGLIFSSFENIGVSLYASPDSSFISGGIDSGAPKVQNFFAIEISGCQISRSPTSTVPAINLVSNINGINNVVLHGGWIHSNGATTPAVKIEGASSANPITGIAVRDLIGEQSCGGLIHLGGVNSARIENVLDWDWTQSYTDTLFKIYTPSGGAAPHGVVIENSGTANASTFAAGAYHVDVSVGTGHRVGQIINGANSGLVKAGFIGSTIASGCTSTRSLRTITSSGSATINDDIIMCNGAGITLTLPDPAGLLNGGTLPYGRAWTVKNRSTTDAVTVVSGGAATIDGSASATVATGAALTFVSIGSSWIIL